VAPSIGMLLALLMAAPMAVEEQAPPAAEGAAANDADRWPYDLPFLADEAIKRGYELPLPRGLSAVYYYVERDIEISDVRLGINGAPLRNVSEFVNLGSRSHVNVAVGRLDAWLLPIVDVYGLVGSVWNNTTTRGTVTIPAQGPRPGFQSFNVSSTTNLNGFVGGDDLTVAGGYRDFFLLGDVNYSQTDIGFDDKFKALIGSIRTGWNGKIQDIPPSVGRRNVLGHQEHCEGNCERDARRRSQLRSRAGARQSIERHSRRVHHPVAALGWLRRVRLQRYGRSNHQQWIDVSFLPTAPCMRGFLHLICAGAGVWQHSRHRGEQYRCPRNGRENGKE
jgi:hypothetical protein